MASRDTSFYYSFLVLPPRKRQAIVAVWDFCRAVDDAVDEIPVDDWKSGLSAEARAKAQAGIAAKLAEEEAKLAATGAEAEARIAKARDAAMANVAGIGADTAKVIVEKLTGRTATAAELAAAQTARG